MHKIRLFSFFSLMFFLGFGASAQQFATIKGTITTSDGKPAAYISVGLKGQGNGTLTDDNGQFTIHRLKPGSYTVKASAVGI